MALQFTVILSPEAPTLSITGALAIILTVKLLVSLRGGLPLSVTLTVIELMLGLWASVSAQVSTPVLESILTPGGGNTRPKVSVFVGTSRSVAVFVTTNVLSSVMVWLSVTVSTGGLFTSVTTTLKEFVVLRLGNPS